MHRSPPIGALPGEHLPNDSSIGKRKETEEKGKIWRPT